ncbi:hypothetical protein GE061_008274 [Apolygus lucorum]|uniref:Protein HIRA n=1 Tax=Apolygus lucorum TaxID=248454 RepID=A0A8S9WRU7_APOLU|nr:hypothetical protein GE061_008274 [Apolygus lucorum]
MKVFKPDWINHDGMSICSIDVHPDGSRVATGGQGGSSGRIVIWNMAPVIDEGVENDESIPKMLCQLDNHLACVNCVRWSYSGKYLASGGDDKLVMIWTISKSLGSNTVFGSKGKVNVEAWRCTHTLRSHNGDVLDMAWSPYDRWLATCSVDNTIIVWRADNFPEIISILKGHTGLVKGVSWDPVGKYLGSQSDDKSVRIWRTCDWSTETVIRKPFEQCTPTTMVLRLSWSPDGQILVTAHAMNGTGPTAQIIERDGWDHSKDMVGHGLAVTCARYSPAITETTKKGKNQHTCNCALGSRDLSVSVWMTGMERPLTVIKDLFSSPVLDLGWSSNGQFLMACSGDGSTAYMEFSSQEIGRPISDHERNVVLEKLYGKVTLGTGNDLLMIENPEILARTAKLKEESKKSEDSIHRIEAKLKKSLKSHSTSATEPLQTNGSSQLCSLTSPVTPNSSNNIDNHLSSKESKGTKKQIETRTSDGRRRITPIFIPLNVENCEEITPFCADSMPSFSSCMSKSRIVIEKRDDVVVTPNVTPAKSTGTQSASTPSKCSTPTLNTTLTQSPKVEVPPSTNAFSSLIATVEKSHTTVKRPRSHTLGMNVKKKKLKETKEVPAPSKRCLSQLPLDLLPPLVLANARHVKLSKTRNYVNVENSVSKGPAGQLSVLRLISPDAEDKPVWELALGAEVCGCVGTADWLALACDDSTLRFVDTRRGTHLVPPICLGSRPSLLTHSHAHVVSITTSGALTLWKVINGLPQAVLYDKSLAPLVPSEGEFRVKECFVNEAGEPVVALSCGKAFLYSVTHNCWLLIANTNDPVMRSTHLSYRSSLRSVSPTESLPLKSVQIATFNGLSTGSGRVSVGSEFGSICTMTYLDTQISSSRALNSRPEYKFWFLALVRFLVQHDHEVRLRSICEDLLGPTYASINNRHSHWEEEILGFNKHALLREVLKEMTQNLKLQRLYTEIVSQLELSPIKEET